MKICQPNQNVMPLQNQVMHGLKLNRNTISSNGRNGDNVSFIDARCCMPWERHKGFMKRYHRLFFHMWNTYGWWMKDPDQHVSPEWEAWKVLKWHGRNADILYLWPGKLKWTVVVMWHGPTGQSIDIWIMDKATVQEFPQDLRDN